MTGSGSIGGFEVSGGDVLLFVGVLVVAMLVIVASYHAMQRPRLVLQERDGVWRPTRRDLVQYAVSMPLLMMLWAVGLQLILLLTNNGLDGRDVVAISISLVVAVRILAHLSREHAHELAKSVPLTIVTLLIVTSTGWRTGSDLDRVTDQLNATDVTWTSFAVLTLSEFVIAAVWYWLGVRWWYPRGHDVPGLPRHARPEPAPDLTATRVRRRARG